MHYEDMATSLKRGAAEEIVERRIYLIRGQKVMLDRDLAELYEVPTKALNQQVRRNLSRFPKDFMFTLTKAETESLRSQIVTAKNRGGSRTVPLAFTEHGVAMLSAVLNSQRAVKMSIAVIRAFVRLREMLSTHKDFALRLEKVETVQTRHGSVIRLLANDIDRLKVLREPKALPEPPKKRRIGFPTA